MRYLTVIEYSEFLIWTICKLFLSAQKLWCSHFSFICAFSPKRGKDHNRCYCCKYRIYTPLFCTAHPPFPLSKIQIMVLRNFYDIMGQSDIMNICIPSKRDYFKKGVYPDFKRISKVYYNKVKKRVCREGFFSLVWVAVVNFELHFYGLYYILHANKVTGENPFLVQWHEESLNQYFHCYIWSKCMKFIDRKGPSNVHVHISIITWQGIFILLSTSLT